MQENRSEWFKSSYSGQNGACVEAAFTRSSYSHQNGDCVETRNHPDSGMDFRDSKNPEGPVLAFGAQARLSFITALKHQAFGADRIFPA